MFLLSSQLICVFSIVILNEFGIVLEYKYFINDYYLNFRLTKKTLVLLVIIKTLFNLLSNGSA